MEKYSTTDVKIQENMAKCESHNPAKYLINTALEKTGEDGDNKEQFFCQNCI